MILIRFSQIDSADVRDRILGILDRIESMPESAGVPIRWNFPSCVHEPEEGRSASDFSARLARRAAAGGDRLITAGRFGSCHPLLSDGEIRADLRSPGGSGGPPAPLDAVEIEAVYPAAPDPSRAHTVYAAAAQGLPILLGEGSRQGKRCLLGFRNGEEIRIPSVRFPLSGGERPHREIARILRRTPSLCLLIDASHPSCADRLAELLVLLSRIGRRMFDLRFPPLADMLETGGSAPESAFPPPLSPAHRYLAREAAELRADSSALDPDPILRHVRRPSARRFNADEPTDPFEWNVVAHMPGSVSLREGDLEARFSAGRLASLRAAEGEILRGLTARSFVMFGGEEAVYLPDGAFSIESESFYGLQTRLSCIPTTITERADLAISCFFAEGYPHLLVHLSGRYPRIPDGTPVWNYAPFELPLFPFDGEPVRIEVAGEGAEAVRGILDEERREALLTGETFYLISTNTSCMIRILSPEAMRREFLSARITGDGMRRLVTVNPAGCYRPVPAETLSEYRIDLLLAMAVGKREALEPFPLPDTVRRIVRPRPAGSV